MQDKICQKIKFKCFSDGRGELVPLECGKNFPMADIPFDVKRCYFISAPTNQDNAVRGKHAHKNLKQAIICMHGACTLDLNNGFGQKISIRLETNQEGIYIEKTIWRELHSFSENCVILVLANQHYTPADYMHDYDDFVKYVHNKH